MKQFCFLLALLTSSAAFGAKGGLESERQARDYVSAHFGDTAGLHWDNFTRSARALMGIRVRAPGKNVQARARYFLAKHSTLFGGIDAGKLIIQSVTRVRNQKVVHLQLKINGLVVDGRYIAVSLDGQNYVRRVSSDMIPVRILPLQNDVGVTVARKAVSARYPGKAISRSTRVILASPNGKAWIAYRWVVAIVPPVVLKHVWIDAQTGQFLKEGSIGRDVPQLERR